MAGVTTDPALNINIAHTPYEFMQGWFTGYWQFWPLCALVVVLLTWLVERGLGLRYPIPVTAVSESQLAAIDDQGMAGNVA